MLIYKEDLQWGIAGAPVRAPGSAPPLVFGGGACGGG